MNGLSRWRIALYLVALFCAGSVSGWVVAAKTTKEKLFTPIKWEEIVSSQRERLHGKLNLTPEQSRKLDAVLERSSAEMKGLFEAHRKNIRQAVNNRNAQISAILTSEQQKLFAQMEKERQESWHRRHSGHEGRHGARDRGTNSSRPKTLSLTNAPQLPPAPSNQAP